MQRAFKSNLDAMVFKRDVPDNYVENAIEAAYNGEEGDPLEDYEENAFELEQYNDYMLHDEIIDEGDPYLIVEEAHDNTLNDLKEQLLDAINNRKSRILHTAVQIFNKVQDQNIKTVKLSSVEELHKTEKIEINPKEINTTLQKFDILLNDPRSPVYSAIQTIAQYKGDMGMPQFGELFRDLEDFFENKIDLESLQREQV